MMLGLTQSNGEHGLGCIVAPGTRAGFSLFLQPNNVFRRRWLGQMVPTYLDTVSSYCAKALVRGSLFPLASSVSRHPKTLSVTRR